MGGRLTLYRRPSPIGMMPTMTVAVATQAMSPRLSASAGKGQRRLETAGLQRDGGERDSTHR